MNISLLNIRSIVGVQAKVTKIKTIVLRYKQCKIWSRYEKEQNHMELF